MIKEETKGSIGFIVSIILIFVIAIGVAFYPEIESGGIYLGNKYIVRKDLNGDDKRDKITVRYGSQGIDLLVKFADQSQEPELLLNIKDSRPADIYFFDIDGDQDLDFTYCKYGKRYRINNKPYQRLDGEDYNMFVCMNDGAGNFSEPQVLIAEKRSLDPNM